jgi:tetratricopeptide (TPR) repeat protein
MSEPVVQPAPPTHQVARGRAWIGIGLIGLAMTTAAYLPSLGAGFYFDDLNNIVDPPAIHWSEVSLEGLRQVTSAAHLPERAMANLTFALNHVHGGLDPTGYHVVNLLIHLAVGVALAWVCFEYIIANRTTGMSNSSAAFCGVAAATLFLVHPLNTQAVTYVVQRMTSLAALFVLLSFGCYLRARRSTSKRRKPVLLGLSGCSWILGILSKETALALPAIVIAYEASIHGEEWRERLTRKLAVPRGRLLVLGVLAAGLFGGALLVSLYVDVTTLSILDTYPNRDFNGLERVLTQFRVQIFYLSLLLWPGPSRLSLEHDLAVSTSLLQPPTTLAAILFWALSAFFLFQLLARRPRYGFPLLAYLMFHLIESAPLNLELVFEHRMYLPMTMLAVFISLALADSNSVWRRRVLAALPVVAIALAAATYARNLVWADPITFHTDCVAKAPNSFRPLYNLGSHLGRAGRLDEAEDAFLLALALEPTDARAHNQIGNILLIRGDLDGAAEHYDAAVSSNPSLPEPLFNLGLIHERLGNIDTALEHYQRFVVVAAPHPFLDAAVRSARERIDVLSRQQ